MLSTTTILAGLMLAPQGPQDHPLAKDRTGIQWVLPFTEARQKAADLDRLLMIKPVAFGTSKEGGW